MSGQAMTALSVVAFFAVCIAFMVYGGSDPWIKQHGRKNVRSRRKLAALLDTWPKERLDGIVYWHKFAALTKRDVIELLFERGWYYRGQDMEADGWPLFATRDARLAESTERPPTRENLLASELRAAAATGRREYDVDLVPYWHLPRGMVAEVAERLGWTVQAARSLGCSPRMHLYRTGIPTSSTDVDR